MGSRGPLRQPFSRRGMKERKAKNTSGQMATSDSATPERPAWLPKTAEAQWDAVLCDLQAAGVPLQRVDAHAIGFYVACVEGAREALAQGDQKTLARISRDAIAWGNLIGATPASRARLNIKPPEPRDENDPWALLDPLEKALL